MRAGYNRKVQSPPLGLDCVGASYNRKVQSPSLGLDCVGARYDRKVESPPLGLDCVGAGYNRKNQSPPWVFPSKIVVLLTLNSSEGATKLWLLFISAATPLSY